MAEKILSDGVRSIIDKGFASQSHPHQVIYAENLTPILARINKKSPTLKLIHHPHGGTDVVHVRYQHIEEDYDRNHNSYFGYKTPLEVILAQGILDDSGQPFFLRPSLTLAGGENRVVGYRDELEGQALIQVGLPLIRTALDMKLLQPPQPIPLPDVIKITLPIKDSPITLYCTVRERKSFSL